MNTQKAEESAAAARGRLPLAAAWHVHCGPLKNTWNTAPLRKRRETGAGRCQCFPPFISMFIATRGAYFSRLAVVIRSWNLLDRLRNHQVPHFPENRGHVVNWKLVKLTRRSSFVHIRQKLWKRESLRIFENLWESLRIFQNLSESFRILKNLSESFRIFQNLSESLRIFNLIWRIFTLDQRIPKNLSESLRIFKLEQRIPKNLWESFI